MKTLTLPTIHINGTSSEALLDGYMKAATAIRKAIDAVHAASPNGRDYYPQGPTALDAAIAEHRARVAKLEEVLEEIRALGESIQA